MQHPESANLNELLRRQSRQRGTADAIIDTYRGRRRRLSFAQLDRAVGQTAALLRQAGLDAGDRVLVFEPMSAELYIHLLALFRLGLVAMFVDPQAGREHIARCCSLCPPRAFIAVRKAHLLRCVVPAVRKIPLQFTTGWLPATRDLRAAQGFEPMDEGVNCDADTPALLTFTSGSTGMPKAAVRSHGFLHAQHAALADNLALHAGEIDLSTLPIFALANLASGVASLIPDVDLRRPGAIDPAPVLKQLDAVAARRTAASPAFLERLLEPCERTGQSLPFTKIYTGGAPVFPDLLARLQKCAPQAAVVAVYGSTEAEPIAHVDYRDIDAADHAAMAAGRGLLAGLPVPEITLRILPDTWGTPIAAYDSATFQQAALPADTAGEIVVSGAHVLPGYLDGRGDSDSKFRVDDIVWHRTGDAGFLDAGGRLWLLGRCAARIHDDNGPLYPFAVECAAQQIAGVRRSALLGRAGRRYLFFEGSAAISDFATLAQRYHIDRVWSVPRLPVDRRHNAKIDYPGLERLLDRQLTTD